MVSWKLNLEVAFGTAPGDEPAPGDWTDLSAAYMVESATVGGTASIVVDDVGRDLDPTNAAGPFHPLLPMRHLRLTVECGGDTFPLFRGFAEKWPPVWPSYGKAQVRIEAVDAFVWIAMSEHDVDLPKQRTDERINALLDLAGWPEAMRDIGEGVVLVQPHAQGGVNVLRLMEDTTDAEDGDLYVAPDGKITFRSRHARFSQSPVLTLDTNPRHDGIPVEAASAQFSAGEVVNIARWEAADGASDVVVDAESVAQVGPHTQTTRDLPLATHEAAGKADWDVYRFGWPQERLTAITVPMGTELEVGSVLGLSRGDLIEVTHAPPGGGEATFESHVESVRHTIAQTWTAALDLSPYHGEGPWATLGESTLGSGDRIAP